MHLLPSFILPYCTYYSLSYQNIYLYIAFLPIRIHVPCGGGGTGLCLFYSVLYLQKSYKVQSRHSNYCLNGWKITGYLAPHSYPGEPVLKQKKYLRRQMVFCIQSIRLAGHVLSVIFLCNLMKRQIESSHKQCLWSVQQNTSVTGGLNTSHSNGNATMYSISGGLSQKEQKALGN